MAKSTLILVDQKGFLPTLVKKISGSRFNHLAVLDQTGLIHDFDLIGYRVFNVDQYPHDFELTTIKSDQCSPFYACYSLTSLLSFPLHSLGLSKISRFIQEISGFNCVSWSLKTMFPNSEKWSSWTVKYPAYFEQFIDQEQNK